MARQDAHPQRKRVRFLGADAISDDPPGVTAAARAFISGMAKGDPDQVWMFASEEERVALRSKPAVLKAYALDFPVLTRAKEATFVRAWREVDTSFIEAIVRDTADRTYRAELGLSLNETGEWKVVSLDIKPTSGFSAGR